VILNDLLTSVLKRVNRRKSLLPEFIPIHRKGVGNQCFATRRDILPAINDWRFLLSGSKHIGFYWTKTTIESL